jgi:large subunit ribosomal protein L20
MARVKRGMTARAAHKKVLKLTEGHRGTKHNIFRRANESMMKSLSYAYRDRRHRKRDMRRLWITRINAAARAAGLPYNDLINGLNRAQVAVDRKMLAEMAVNDTAVFNALVDVARAHLAAAL